MTAAPESLRAALTEAKGALESIRHPAYRTGKDFVITRNTYEQAMAAADKLGAILAVEPPSACPCNNPECHERPDYSLVPLVRKLLKSLESHVAEDDAIRLDRSLMPTIDALREIAGKEDR